MTDPPRVGVRRAIRKERTGRLSQGKPAATGKADAFRIVMGKLNAKGLGIVL